MREEKETQVPEKQRSWTLPTQEVHCKTQVFIKGLGQPSGTEQTVRDPSRIHRTEESVGRLWNLTVCDGDDSFLRQAVKCRFSGTVEYYKISQGCLVGKELLRIRVRFSWVYRRPWLRKKTYILRNHRELRSRTGEP